MNNQGIALRDDPIKQLLATNMPVIKNVLPKHLTPERIMRIAYTAISTTPKLRECSHASLLNCILTASMLGLEIGNTMGYAYLIPFKTQATLIIGYKGYQKLAWQSGKIKSFSYHPVYENDTFSYEYGLDPKLKHVPSTENRGKLKYAYAVVQYKEGGFDFEVVTQDDINVAKKRSVAVKCNKKDSPWLQEDLEYTMWCKTAVRKLSKRLPQSPELMQAINIEEQAEVGINAVEKYIKIDTIENDPVTAKLKTEEPKSSIDKTLDNGCAILGTLKTVEIAQTFDNSIKTKEDFAKIKLSESKGKELATAINEAIDRSLE